MTLDQWRDKFHAAALDFCRQEADLRKRRAANQRCTEASNGDHAIGDYGVPLCDTKDPEAKRCGPCEARFQGYNGFTGSLRLRRLAKERMMRAASHLQNSDQDAPFRPSDAK